MKMLSNQKHRIPAFLSNDARHGRSLTKPYLLVWDTIPQIYLDDNKNLAFAGTQQFREGSSANELVEQQQQQSSRPILCERDS